LDIFKQYIQQLFGWQVQMLAQVSLQPFLTVFLMRGIIHFVKTVGEQQQQIILCQGTSAGWIERLLKQAERRTMTRIIGPESFDAAAVTPQLIQTWVSGTGKAQLATLQIDDQVFSGCQKARVFASR
jgi:hypothetical protein